MPVYKRSIEIERRVGDLIETAFDTLHDAGVTVDVLVSYPTEEEGGLLHSLFDRGYPCAAKIKVTPYEKRVLGVADAVIIIDAKTWQDRTPGERDAILHHELNHLVVAQDQHGDVKLDKAERPVLRIRLHDVQIGWFGLTARIYQNASLEVQQGKDLLGQHEQSFFPWLADKIDSHAERKALANGLIGERIVDADVAESDPTEAFGDEPIEGQNQTVAEAKAAEDAAVESLAADKTKRRGGRRPATPAEDHQQPTA